MSKTYQPAGINMTTSKTELGNFIRTCRLKLDLRQASLAKRVGLKQNVLSNLEIGTKKYLKDYHLQKLAKALRCDPEELRKRMPKKHGVEPTTELGKLIRSRREELGLTLGDLAKKMHITLQQAWKMEIHNPRIRHTTGKLLARALNLDPSALAAFVGSKQKPTVSELGRLIR